MKTTQLHTLELRDVLALLRREAWSDRSTGIAMDSRTSTALAEKWRRESEMAAGWKPFVNSFWEVSSIAPEKIWEG